MSRRASILIPTLAALAWLPLGATETENLGIRVLPAASPVAVDGEFKEWNLSAGLFGCGDVENQRDKFGFWAHASYDAQNLYVLMRYVDPTPLNNPGQVEGSYGWDGDSLQFRIIVGDGLKTETGRASHWTCWSGRDGKTIMDVAYGLKFDKGAIKDAVTKGAKQVFKVLPDKSGYTQELSIPWSLVAPEGWKPTAGEEFRLTFEPNFTVGSGGRLSAKDCFAPDVLIDRVFTFMGSQFWGHAVLAKSDKVEPTPLRLSDKREFPVHMADGVPAIDWAGLIKQKELAGHKVITFDMPYDGYVSLNIFAPDGSVARQLLTTAFYTKGKHEVKWDGLSTWSWRDPGDPLPVGSYTWQALVHPGIDLKLVGWANNAGSAPWDGPSGKDNWGGDHGAPTSAATLGDKVLLGWSGAEAGKAMIAVDFDGKVQWKHSRGGMAMCSLLAADGKYVYGVNYGDNNTTFVFRIDLATGSYASWPGKDSPDLSTFDLLTPEQQKSADNRVDSLAARDGQLFIGNAKGNLLLVCDGETGALKKSIKVPSIGALAAIGAGKVYCVTGKTIQLIDTATGSSTKFADVADASSLTVDGEGLVYVSVRGAAQQVVVLDKAGKRVRTIGRAGGRPASGPWQQDTLLNPNGLTVDGKGQLWVTEEANNPKRVSVWNAKTGAFVREFFGPANYGALGGNISLKDPLIMAGMGAEWRLDPKTGQSVCVGVIDQDGFSNSRFGIGSNGHEYLLTALNWAFDQGPLKVYEHISPGVWKLRSMVIYRDGAGKDIVVGHGPSGATTTLLWADRNDDGKQDANELSAPVPGLMSFSNWYMQAAPDMTLYSGERQFRVSGFTACGAPMWDFSKPTTMPSKGMGSADGSMVLTMGDYGAAHSWFQCFDIATKKRKWIYPDTFVGVHGSHNAPPAEVGLIRGSYGVCGVAKLPDPIGNVWVIATNVGEMHMLTDQGFYLGRMFQPDPIKVAFPEKAVPGVIINDAPSGMGGEDFGGSATFAKDGHLYIQAGKTGYWNVQVEGLDKIVQLKGAAPIAMVESDLALSQKFREQGQQALIGVQRLVVKELTPGNFSGNLANDFPNAKIVSFEKDFGTQVRSVVSWDASNLHLGWEVQDKSVWTNAARSADAMYWGGDTVDFQLATDPAAPADRGDPVKGDLRLSIGSLSGKETAVIFRKVWDQKAPKMFTSGVIKDYKMDSVVTLTGAKIVVTKRNDGYTVEASIPLKDLGFTPKAGLKLKGDLGVTFGNQAGDRTRLRSYWSNQHVGIVDDVVFELKMEPKYWGELVFE